MNALRPIHVLYRQSPIHPFRLHIYFIAYERAVHTLVALFSALRRQVFRLSSWDLMWLSVRLHVTMRPGPTYVRLMS